MMSSSSICHNWGEGSGLELYEVPCNDDMAGNTCYKIRNLRTRNGRKKISLKKHLPKSRLGRSLDSEIFPYNKINQTGSL